MVAEKKLKSHSTTTRPAKAVLKSDTKPTGNTQPADIRRLDWRFLLPVPTLGNVGFVGSQQSMLLQALDAFSETVGVLGGDNEHREHGFDLLVVESQKPYQWQSSIGFLKPGGFLYWEIRKPLFRRHAYYLAQIQTMEFYDARVYWHRPNFRACKEIIPVEDKTALEYVFSRNQAGLKGNVLKLAAPVLVQSSLLGYLAPCVSIVARYNSRQDHA